MSEREDMTCRELVAFLLEYLDGGLDATKRRVFEEHLSICPSCVAYVESYRRTIRLGKAAFEAGDEPASSAAPAGLVEAIRAARRRSG